MFSEIRGGKHLDQPHGLGHVLFISRVQELTSFLLGHSRKILQGSENVVTLDGRSVREGDTTGVSKQCCEPCLHMC